MPRSASRCQALAVLLFVALTSSACISLRKETARPEAAPASPAAGKTPHAGPPVMTFTAEDVEIESVLPEPIGTCRLGATLLTPDGPQRPRALVVLIHGSGPLDRNGTIAGGYHPYRDLAEHLATAGYASIRFDKRAALAPCAKRLAEALRAEHFLKDVVTVTTFAKQQPGFSDAPLVLLGHSEGSSYALELTTRGWLAPDALVLMAGLGRYPLDATFLRQLRDRMMAPATPAAARLQIEALLKQGEAYFLRIREGEAKPNDFYVGAYAAFWTDMIQMTDRTAQTASQVKVPSLLLQGTRDTNVAREDFEALSSALLGVPGAKAEMIAGLDHLFTKEDQVRVAPEALQAIVDWLSSLDVLAPAAPSPPPGESP